MYEAKEVARSPKLDDNVQLTRLSPIDMFRLLLKQLNNDDAQELENAERVSEEHLRRVGSLTTLFEKAVRKMNDLHENSVTLKLSSVYIPYIDEVTSDVTGLGKFYKFTYNKDTGIPLSVPHSFICVISVKE